ncbi:DUF433 domain-containing protein [Nocardia sp. NPDC051929]|uniref:DUF433 domain-containing protein n=1 Tax=unclassified Nocardia TaxID=2637762 RepID=UPI00344007BA
MSLQGRITSDPAICHGKPVIRGLRYPVEMILDLLASGMTIDDLLADHPDLEADDILAALAYAATAVKSNADVCERRRGNPRQRLTADELVARHCLLPRVDSFAMRLESDMLFGEGMRRADHGASRELRALEEEWRDVD